VALRLAAGCTRAEEPDRRGGPLRVIVPAGPVRHGQTLRVSVEPGPGTPVVSVLLVSQSFAENDEEPPFQFDFVVPPDAVGEIRLLATGKGPDGRFHASPEVTLEVASSLDVKEIRVWDRRIFISRVGDVETVPAEAIVAGGESVSLTPSPSDDRDAWLRGMPVAFESRDPTIATVDAYGEVRAVGVGETILDIRLAGLTASVPVVVNTDNVVPVVTVERRYRCLAPGSWFVLEGAAHDPDDGPRSLTVRWLWNRHVQDLPFKNTSGVRLADVAPDVPKFRVSLWASDGEADADAEVHVYIDQDRDGRCVIEYPDQLVLETEPAATPPR
jgi:hypothetical protein